MHSYENEDIALGTRFRLSEILKSSHPVSHASRAHIQKLGASVRDKAFGNLS